MKSESDQALELGFVCFEIDRQSTDAQLRGFHDNFPGD